MNNIMKLADAYAEASFDQGLDRTENDTKPEEARAALEAAVNQQAAEIERLRQKCDHSMSVVNRLTVERDALQSEIERLKASELELERLCDATYVAKGADAYNHACEEMERFQEQRREAGKEVGTERSLCDGMAWVYGRIDELEAKLSAMESVEPVAIYHARCTIDCGEHGHHDVELLKLIPAGTKLFTAPKVAQPDRVIECAARLIEHANFQLGGILSADSKAKDIPSRAVSQVKSRHLAALRDALTAHNIGGQHQ